MRTITDRHTVHTDTLPTVLTMTMMSPRADHLTVTMTTGPQGTGHTVDTLTMMTTILTAMSSRTTLPMSVPTATMSTGFLTSAAPSRRASRRRRQGKVTSTGTCGSGRTTSLTGTRMPSARIVVRGRRAGWPPIPTRPKRIRPRWKPLGRKPLRQTPPRRTQLFQSLPTSRFVKA